MADTLATSTPALEPEPQESPPRTVPGVDAGPVPWQASVRGRLNHVIARLGLVDVVMLAGIVGGAVWLALTYLTAIHHGAALMLAVLVGVVALIKVNAVRA